MCEKHDYQYVDGLIQSIETILSEDRCSFSDDEKVQLSSAIRYLEDSKKVGDEKPIDWSLIWRGLDLFYRVFSNFDSFPNIF